MASGLIVLVLLLLALAMDGPATVAARPIQAAVASIWVATGLVCEADMDYFLPAAADTAGVATRDTTIETINDFQRDFFLERALVKGGKMHLDQNLHDPIPRREFLAAASAAQLPAISTENLQPIRNIRQHLRGLVICL